MTPATQTTTLTCRPLQNLTMPCPKCGEPEACIEIKLNYLADGEEFHCAENDCTFSADDVRTLIAKWSRFLPVFDQLIEFAKDEAERSVDALDA